MLSLRPTLLDRAVMAPGRVDHLFGEVLSGIDELARWPAVQPSGSRPLQVQVAEDGYRLRCELPGYEAEDVLIEVAANVLTIRAARREGDQILESVSHAIHLGHEVDPEAARAELRNGVLVVTLPRSETSRPRRIEVRTGASLLGDRSSDQGLASSAALAAAATADAA